MTDILNLPQDEKRRVMVAVNTICSNNTDAVNQLEKIAAIKDKKPLVWQMLIIKLKNL